MNEVMNVQPTLEVAKTETHVIENMGRAYKLAQTMCQANIIPDSYKNKPADCMIAIDMAERMGVSPLMVMQSLYVVKGKPSWSGQACMSFIQANPHFKDVEPVYVGQPNTDEWGCYISAIRTSTGKEVRGTLVTIKMAKAEGWYGRSGSKWLTMPELMLGYRASAFFARIYCPNLLMGVAVEGENEDVAVIKERKAVDVL